LCVHLCSVFIIDVLNAQYGEENKPFIQLWMPATKNVGTSNEKANVTE
jgi:hypothetical protein